MGVSRPSPAGRPPTRVIANAKDDGEVWMRLCADSCAHSRRGAGRRSARAQAKHAPPELVLDRVDVHDKCVQALREAEQLLLTGEGPGRPFRPGLERART